MTASGRPGEITPRQHVAISTLLGTGSSQRAAVAARVSERTIRRWRQTDTFQAATRSAARQVAAESTSRLLGVQCEAIETLRRNLHSPSHAVQVRAARALAELALRATDDDFDMRLDALERQVTAWQHTDNGDASLTLLA
jgi:hypothetical protein